MVKTRNDKCSPAACTRKAAKIKEIFDMTEQDSETGKRSAVKRLVMCKPVDMEKAVKHLTNYMATYDKQHGYKEYDTKTYIEDVLYGLAVSLNQKEFSCANGLQKFKQELRQYLDT